MPHCGSRADGLRCGCVIFVPGAPVRMPSIEAAAEGSDAATVGSRLALSRHRLRRLTALSRHSLRPLGPPWLRRSALGSRPGLRMRNPGST